MRKLILVLLLLSAGTFTLAQDSAKSAEDKPVAVSDADQAKLNALVTDLRNLQTAVETAQAKIQAAVFEAMARKRLSPDDYEAAIVDGKFVFRRKAPPVKNAKP